MQFLHLGDLHLGKTLGEFDLIDDQKYLLEQVIRIAKDRKIDRILIAGDIYDRAIPPESAVRLLDWFLKELVKNQIKVYLISGNHDSDERLNFGSSFLEDSGIYLSAKYEGELKHLVCEDEFGEINIYLMPFVKYSQVRHYFPDEEIKDYSDAVRVILKHADIDPAARNIITAHQFVAGGGKAPVLGGSESPVVRQIIQDVGTVENIGAELFDAFDYAALGHIHSPQKIMREEVRYSGSLMKYSLSEVNSEKSVPCVTIGEKGHTEIELIPLKPERDLRHIKGPAAKLLAQENISDSNDFIYATLTDEDVIPDIMGLFQLHYPNTVKIDYENSHTKALEQAEFTEMAEEKPFAELFGDFYRVIYGEEMTEEMTAVMLDAAREAGVTE